ncbi:MAG TPA: tyrosine-type recombinase/integrase [Candidatus Pullichristensenella stercorigallinarum]|uniref:Tyrosine-type recombinase/integrase n=1 Tax=Candidatus Pullichristensenella stercorigallinarum TaxID=2840909 RepID=A0A9D1CXD6_9FIRM|nr:tyrosine-type recombinase/integrase [Candidatus Pullichristensenella stercorigallinarum]
MKRTIDIHGMTPYIGRHTYLTALNREGVDLKTIQAIAGHEDERMALRTYIHCDETLVTKAGKTMEAHFERMAAM